jgi:serine/threonine protein kinase
MDGTERQLLQNEIHLICDLANKNIVHCFDIVESQTHVYIIMELIAGGELTAYMHGRKFSGTES